MIVLQLFHGSLSNEISVVRLSVKYLFLFSYLLCLCGIQGKKTIAELYFILELLNN